MHYIGTNANGDYLGDGDLLPFCSESCRTEYAREHDISEDLYLTSDGSDSNEYCAACGVIAHVGAEQFKDGDACQCQADNLVVNRFTCDTGETCKHGNWIQLPVSYLD
jgi:hypothetical protein